MSRFPSDEGAPHQINTATDATTIAGRRGGRNIKKRNRRDSWKDNDKHNDLSLSLSSSFSLSFSFRSVISFPPVHYLNIVYTYCLLVIDFLPLVVMNSITMQLRRKMLL